MPQRAPERSQHKKEKPSSGQDGKGKKMIPSLSFRAEQAEQADPVEPAERANLVKYYFKAENQNQRPYMEDRSISWRHHDGETGLICHIYAVFDGHGGAQVADHLATHFPSYLYHQLLGTMRKIHMTGVRPEAKSWLQELQSRTVHAFRVYDARHFSTTDVGSTATVVCLFNLRPSPGACVMLVAQLGDSRFLLVGQTPLRIAFATQDHKPAGPTERKRIEAAGGSVQLLEGAPRVNGILAVSRSFGDSNLKPFVSGDPDVSIRVVTKPFWGLIMSDGVTDALSNQQIVKMWHQLQLGGNGIGPLGPGSACEVVLEYILRMGKSLDNLTLIAFPVPSQL